jgi:transcriptional regulator with XRE-family HTH domain
LTAPVEDDGSAGGPATLRVMLGAQLRQLREARGLSRGEAGNQIRSSQDKIRRMELGLVSFKERDLADLLTLYGVTEHDERDQLLTLARTTGSPGWWHRYGDVVPTWFRRYLDLEAAATAIRSYEVQFVPGLLQSADYARAVILLGHRHAPAAEIDRRVSLRMERQRILTRRDPPQLWVVMDEAVLRRPVGGHDVMRRQLEALIEAGKRPNVRLQIIPFHVGGHSAASGAFSILQFQDQYLPDLVYVEQFSSASYLDRRDDVDHYIATMHTLTAEGDPPSRTLATLTAILAGLDDELTWHARPPQP